MGLNLEAFEAFKKQASSSGGGNGSGSGSVSNNSSSGSKSSGVGSSYERGNNATSPYTKDKSNGPNSGSIFSIEDEGYAASSARDAIDHLLESSLFDRGLNDGAHNIKSNVLDNDGWKVDMDIDGDGTVDQGVKLADAIAASFDSELDLYIEDKVQEIIKKYQCYSFKELFGSENSAAVKELAALGIRADGVGDDEDWQNRTYSFSLVELPPGFEEMTPEEQMEYVYSDDAKILEDANGKKGSCIFADSLVPDGMAQGAEMNMSSILDTMGYDCISKADFVGKEDEYHSMMQEVSEMLANGEYSSDGTTHADIYSENTLRIWDAVCAVHTSQGVAAGIWGRTITFQETVDYIEKYGLPSGGSLSKTFGASGDSSETGELAEANKLEQEEKENNEKDIEAKQEKILEDLVSKYESEHNEKPVGEDLVKLENEAKARAKTQA